jgi:hypothetical protein
MNALVNWRERWTAECDEWRHVRDELLERGERPTAFEVSQELYRRMRARGDKPLQLRAVLSSVPPPNGGSQ